MPVLDEKGRVFGKINVIDLGVLVVVGLLALAALSFLVAGGSPVPVHVQADLNDVPAEVAGGLAAGHELDHGKAILTDVLIVERSGQSARVFVKLRVMAEDTGAGLRYRQQILSPGLPFRVVVPDGPLHGTVALVDGRPELTYLAGPEPMVLATVRTSGSIAGGLAVGQVGQTAGNDLFRITDVLVFPGSEATASAYLAGERLRLAPAGSGAALLVPGATAEVAFPSGSVSVVAHRMEGNVASALPTQWVSVRLLVRADPGEWSLPALGPLGPSGSATANVTGWIPVEGGTINEASAIVQASGGTEGVLRSAWIDLAVLAIPTADGFQYRGASLLPGETVTVPSGAGSFKGTVVLVGADAGPAAPLRVSLLARNVPPTAALPIVAGAAESGPGDPAVVLVSVGRAASLQLLVTSDGRLVQAQHPVNLDLTIEATLLVEGGGGLFTFRGQPLTPGARFVIVPGGVPLEVEVLSVGTP